MLTWVKLGPQNIYLSEPLGNARAGFFYKPDAVPGAKSSALKTQYWV